MRAPVFLIPLLLCCAKAQASDSQEAPLLRLQVADPVALPLGQIGENWKLKDLNTLLLEAEGFLRGQRYNAALDCCDEILERRPNMTVARWLRGDVIRQLDSFDRGDFDTAHEQRLRSRSRELKQSDSGHIGLKPGRPR